MKTEKQLLLFMATNPTPFQRYEDHLAGIEMQILEMVQNTQEGKEAAAFLIKEYLHVPTHAGMTANELTNHILQSGPMSNALYDLRQNWEAYDPNLPGNSKQIESSNFSAAEIREHYMELDLRAFLEHLYSYL